ncbi:MAG TPA: penicillin acylase family protein [Anaerolineales bacterium]
MPRFIRKALLGLLAFIGILALVLAALIPINVRRSFPPTNGGIQLAGLDNSVDIFRDEFGIPHIYASSAHDLFFAQGYVHAQDRFWQMDFWRHQGAGRLSELLGEATLETDIFLRTLGWERVARQELETLDLESVAILEAYSEGVNAYLAARRGAAVSLEYFFLPILNRGYQIEPWKPLNTLTWGKAMAWDLRANLDSEVDRARLLKSMPPEQVAQLFPAYPSDHPVIVSNPPVTVGSKQSLSTGGRIASAVYPALDELSQQLASMPPLFGEKLPGMGSNSWAISGDLTTTGGPILANDPHLSAQMPSIWYQVGLHCVSKAPDCPYDITGFSFAGAPGVIIGHSDRIAWGFTNLGADVMDLYIEKINPDNSNQYEFEGEWVDMRVLTETIQVAGGEPEEISVRITRHGPIITEAYGLQDFAQETGIDLPENYALALRWTALEPGRIFRAIWSMNRAQNWEEFRQAARHLNVPSQNLVYADVDGNIGYQMPGNIPIRSDGHTGELPVPGWTGEYEWQGYIPFEELPFTFNPPEGYIVTANNAVVGPEYPYIISTDWDNGFRAQRIVNMIQNAPEPISMEFVQQMQGDNRFMIAGDLLQILLEVPLETERLQQARELLVDWDYQFDMDSAAAALFASFWKHLLAATFEDQLPEFYKPSGADDWMDLVRRLAHEPDSSWWDDQNTSAKESRDEIFQKAFSLALSELEDSLGDNPAEWSWGELHTLTFENQVMSNFPLINQLFNRGPFPTSGGSDIVNATGWNASRSYEVTSLPSMRMIVDLSNLSNSLSIHTTGQSGHPYHPHYIDMADPWRSLQYHPMLWERGQVESAAASHLRLLP